MGLRIALHRQPLLNIGISNNAVSHVTLSSVAVAHVGLLRNQLERINRVSKSISSIAVPIFPFTKEDLLTAGNGDFLTAGDGTTLTW